MDKVNREVKLAAGLHPGLGGRVREPETRQSPPGNRHSADLLVIMLVLYSMFRIVQVGPAGAAESRPGAALAVCWRCVLTGTHFSVSTGVGFLALFGVSVQTGVIMIEYINQLRARGMSMRGSGAAWARPAACGPS